MEESDWVFYINKETELTTELLDKMINRFRLNVKPKLEKYKNYYDGKDMSDNIENDFKL